MPTKITTMDFQIALVVRLLPLIAAFWLEGLEWGIGSTVFLVLLILLTALVGRLRSRVALGQSGVQVDSLFGFSKRWVPASAVANMEFDGEKLVALNEEKKVLFRAKDKEHWAETFAAIDAARANLDPTPTGFERGSEGLGAWLAAIDGRVKKSAPDGYRSAFDWELTLDVFRSLNRSAESRAGAAWALLGSSEPRHREAVLGAASPELPPIVLAVCALHPQGSSLAPLARAKLGYLSRADRREWKRLARG